MGEDGEKTGVWSFEESGEKIGKMGRIAGGRLGIRKSGAVGHVFTSTT